MRSSSPRSTVTLQRSRQSASTSPSWVTAPARAVPTASAVTDIPAARNASTSCGSAVHTATSVPPTIHIGSPHSAPHHVAQREASLLPIPVSSKPRA